MDKNMGGIKILLLDWCNWDSFDQQIPVFTLKEMRGKKYCLRKVLSSFSWSAT